MDIVVDMSAAAIDAADDADDRCQYYSCHHDLSHDLGGNHVYYFVGIASGGIDLRYHDQGCCGNGGRKVLDDVAMAMA